MTLAGRSGRARPNSAAGPRSSNVSAGDSAKLGWTISILAILACALASSYSGSAIARVKNEFYTNGDNADGYAHYPHLLILNSVTAGSSSTTKREVSAHRCVGN